MTTQGPDPLAALRDIQLPDPVAFWPPAPGWWLAAALCAAMIVAAILFARARRRSMRRAALRELSAVEGRFESRGDPAELAQGLSALLRRTALARFPDASVAALHGAHWLRFLAGRGGKAGFPADVCHGLENAVCMGPVFAPRAGETDRWIASVRAWIRSHS